MKLRPSSCLAAGVLAASALAARRRAVGSTEACVFRRVNGAPDGWEMPAWVVMQAGSLGGVIGVSAVLARSQSRRAAEVFGVGFGVWLAMKLVKPLVGRGRPAELLDDVVVRGAPQNGLGYPSGHAAVSTTLALITTVGPARWLALSVAAAAGSSRMYVGAHLPLDVAGGYAAGALAASAAASVLSSGAGSS